MPGQISINTTEAVRTEFVKALFSAADEAEIVANSGFGGSYVPTSSLILNGVGPDANGVPSEARIIVTGDAGQDDATAELVRDAIEEFFLSLTKCHELVGKLMRGEITDGPGISGADNWRETFAGASYDAGDGEGSFTVTVPE